MHDLHSFVRSQLEDPASHWSLGTFGAIAEFVRDRGEAVDLVLRRDALEACTARGALRFRNVDAITAVASETATRSGWSHRVAFCLPHEDAAMGRRTVLTELGPDVDAVRAQDRDAVLFDVGLGTMQVDVCVRTSDPAVIAALRAGAGRSVFDPASSAMAAILATSPQRVFVCRFGRIEVFQPIPPPDGRSPEGPHTHLLPSLLRHGLTHAATEPIPDGLVPCAHLYPPHAVKDISGQRIPFQPDRHDAFQAILARYGDPVLLDAKRRVFAALRAGADPERVAIPDSRFARNARRVAIQQWRALTGGLAPPRSSRGEPAEIHAV